MLTARGVALTGLAVVAWMLGRFLGVDELYVVSGTAAALVVLAIVSTRMSSTRIAVRRRTAARYAHQGERIPIELALRNDGRLPASLLLVEDRRPPAIVADGADEGARVVVQGLRPHQMANLEWHAVGNRRGRYTVGPVRIRLRDPFGLAERSRRYRGTDEIVVFPAIEQLSTVGTHGIRHGMDSSASRRVFHRGDEFHTMRTYVVGDDLRHVHWPSTAHRGTLMVRQHELPWQAGAVVYVDARAHLHRGTGRASTFERAISAAASVLAHLQQQRYDVRLVTDDGPGAQPDGGSQLETAMTRLAELRPATDHSPLPALRTVEQTGNGVLVAVLRPPPDDLDLAEHIEVRALQQAGHSYTGRIALVIGHDDDVRCATFARLLGLGGWHSAVAQVGTPLDDAWKRALVGADIARTVGASR
ncbi:MAG: DUF58 domain-containing protein [Actinobacteria bacterium]|nr:DUF58 domain-containing protein [Actinomycetota bacterium]